MDHTLFHKWIIKQTNHWQVCVICRVGWKRDRPNLTCVIVKSNINEWGGGRSLVLSLGLLQDNIVRKVLCCLFLFLFITWEFISRRIKKGEGQGKEKCHAKPMMSNESNERLKYTLTMCRSSPHLFSFSFSAFFFFSNTANACHEKHTRV